MQKLILSAAIATRKAIDVDSLTAFVTLVDIPPMLRAGEAAIAAGEAVLAAGMADVLVDVMAQSAARSTIPPRLLARKPPAEGANPLAVEWARLFSATRVRETTRQQRAAIRAIIDEALATGLPPRESAVLIRDVVGLTRRQAASVTNVARDMREAQAGDRVKVGKRTLRAPANGFSAATISREVGRYAAQVHARRALTIARTETIRASNMGQQELWRLKRNQGLLSGHEGREWIVTPDDRLCPRCAALDGVVVGFEERFPGDVLTPPLHPNCRCTIALVPIGGRRATEAVH